MIKTRTQSALSSPFSSFPHHSTKPSISPFLFLPFFLLFSLLNAQPVSPPTNLSKILAQKPNSQTVILNNEKEEEEEKVNLFPAAANQVRGGVGCPCRLIASGTGLFCKDFEKVADLCLLGGERIGTETSGSSVGVRKLTLQGMNVGI